MIADAADRPSSPAISRRIMTERKSSWRRTVDQEGGALRAGTGARGDEQAIERRNEQ
jgi:hypothetical protein